MLVGIFSKLGYGNFLVNYLLTCYTLILHVVYVNCAVYMKIKI